VPREPLRVDGGRGDDHLEVRPPRQELGEIAEDEVDVEAALMGLVDDQRVVAPHPVVEQLGQQDAVGHHLDQGVVAGVVAEAHLVADRAAERRLQLLGNALGDGAGGQPPRLRVPDRAAHAAPQLQAHLGELGGLAGAGLAGHDHDLVVAHRRQDLVPLARDRQCRRVADLGHGRTPPGDAPLGGVDLGGDLGHRRLTGLGAAQLAGAVQPPPQALLVGQGQLAQARGQFRGWGLHGRARGPFQAGIGSRAPCSAPG